MSYLDFIHASPFNELTALIALAAIIGFIGVLLHQPMNVSFIAVGILAGPSAGQRFCFFLGHISAEPLGLVTLVGLITISMSVY